MSPKWAMVENRALLKPTKDRLTRGMKKQLKEISEQLETISKALDNDDLAKAVLMRFSFITGQISNRGSVKK